jgi:hypothetical protein
MELPHNTRSLLCGGCDVGCLPQPVHQTDRPTIKTKVALIGDCILALADAQRSAVNCFIGDDLLMPYLGS